MAIGKINVPKPAAINKDKMLKEIEKKAYELFQKRGGKNGSDLNDWLEAEKIIKKQYNIK